MLLDDIRNEAILVKKNPASGAETTSGKGNGMTGRHGSGKAKQISEAAFHLFLEQGYEATGIRQICRDADVELTTLYYHFNSKKGLFLWLADSLLETFMPDKPTAAHASSAQEYLRDYFLFSIRYVICHQEETRFFLRYKMFPPRELREDISHILKKIQNSKTESILPYMTQCIAQGVIALPLEQAMTAYWQFISGNTFNVVFADWTPDDAELTRLWKTFLHCHLSGRYHDEAGVSE